MADVGSVVKYPRRTNHETGQTGVVQEKISRESPPWRGFTDGKGQGRAGEGTPMGQ